MVGTHSKKIYFHTKPNTIGSLHERDSSVKWFFCSFDPIYVEDLRSDIFLVSVENLLRKAQFYFPLHIRGIRQDSFGVFSICA
jgi:hypothetical protein